MVLIIFLLLISIFQYTLYFGLGALLEYTNPIPKTDYRRKMTVKEIALGMNALFWIIIVTIFGMWKLEPLSPYYNYYETHEYGLKEFIISSLV